MKGNFFAMISRMRNIRRWCLMRNSYDENIQEHSHMTAVLAHALAVIRRDVFGGSADPEMCATAALFHDASEIITGDLPTPVKYLNPEITGSYKAVERAAEAKLVGTLSNIGLHHRSAENDIQLILLKLTIKRAEGAFGRIRGHTGVKCFVYGYGIDLFHKNLLARVRSYI